MQVETPTLARLVIFKLLVEGLVGNGERLVHVLLRHAIMPGLLETTVETLHGRMNEIALSSCIECDVHAVVAHAPTRKPTIRAAVIILEGRG